jgi:transcription elongation factor GreA
VNAAGLIRSVGLLADGPQLWGRPVASRTPGVYLVELPEPMPDFPADMTAIRAWIERVPSLLLDGQRPTPHELAARLAGFWLPSESVVYVGMTPASLGGRIAAFYRTPLGDRRPHAGGHWLKTLRVLDQLRIWWAETDAPEEYEDALLSAFADSVPPEARQRLHDPNLILPFANRETSTGERKAHGIGASLLAGTDTGIAPAGAPAKRAPARPGGAARKVPATPRSRAAAGRPAVAPTQLSRDRLEQMRAELTELTEVRRPEIVARVKTARELGDLRENADYEAARNEQSFNEGRIQTLQNLLRTAVELPEETQEPGGEVRIGSTVVVQSGTGQSGAGESGRGESAGSSQTYRIVAPTEASPGDGRISYLSPIGRAFLGRRAGDTVIVRAPAGDVVYRILEVT